MAWALLKAKCCAFAKVFAFVAAGNTGFALCAETSIIQSKINNWVSGHGSPLFNLSQLQLGLLNYSFVDQLNYPFRGML